MMNDGRARRIKSVLILKGIKQRDVAKAAHVTPGLVNGFITGRWWSAKVAQALIDVGVPASLLKKAKKPVTVATEPEEKDCEELRACQI